jgi:hypothetical protein
MSSHCSSDQNGGTSQIPVSQCGADTVTISDATGGAGHRRGILVWLHPSFTTDLPRPYTVVPSASTLEASANADGWIFAFPAYTFDWSVRGATSTSANISNDCANDSGHGSRLQTTLLWWWDHMVNYLASVYGPNRPTILGGFSLGAWAALTIAINRPGTLVGYIAHCPATIWSNITFGNVAFPANTSGMDLSATCLNAVTIPGIVGWSNTDGVAGYTNGTPAHGGPVSNTIQFITAAQGASQPVTSYESSSDEAAPYPNGHLFLTGDANEYCTPTTGWIQTTLDGTYPVSF